MEEPADEVAWDALQPAAIDLGAAPLPPASGELSVGQNDYLCLDRIMSELAPKALRQAFPRMWDQRYPDDKWSDIDGVGRKASGELLLKGQSSCLRLLPGKFTWKDQNVEYDGDIQKDLGGQRPARLKNVNVELVGVHVQLCLRVQPSSLWTTLSLSITDTKDDVKDKVKVTKPRIPVPNNLKLDTHCPDKYKGYRGAPYTGLQLMVPRILPPINIESVKNEDAQDKILKGGLAEWDMTLLTWAISIEEGHGLGDGSVQRSINNMKNVRNTGKHIGRCEIERKEYAKAKTNFKDMLAKLVETRYLLAKEEEEMLKKLEELDKMTFLWVDLETHRDEKLRYLIPQLNMRSPESLKKLLVVRGLDADKVTETPAHLATLADFLAGEGVLERVLFSRCSSPDERNQLLHNREKLRKEWLLPHPKTSATQQGPAQLRKLSARQMQRAQKVLAIVLEAANEHVCPRMCKLVHRTMGTFQRENICIDPRLGDDVEFAAYSVLLHEHCTHGSREAAVRVTVKAVTEQAVRVVVEAVVTTVRVSALSPAMRDRIRSNVPTDAIAREAFFARPAWQRTAAMYIDSPNIAKLDVWNWDLNSLCTCVRNCDAFKESERDLAAHLQERVLRSVFEGRAVDDCCGDPNAYFTAMLEVIKKTLVELGVACQAAEELLKPHRDGMACSMPACDTLEEARQHKKEADAAVVKLMTKEQEKSFDELQRAERPCTWIIEAPAGSGKTLIAVKLVAANLRNQQTLGPSAAAPALLLVHTRALQRHVLRELMKELKGEAMTIFVREGMDRLKLGRVVEAFVATVDALSTELVADENAQSEDEVTAWLFVRGIFIFSCLDIREGRDPTAVPLGKFGLVVVDEGHHVFSKPIVDVEGQNRFDEPDRVRQVVDACLNPKEHRLIVFHDDSHQRDGVEPCYPPYIPDGTQDTPEGRAKQSQVTIKNRPSLFLTHVVRLPGAARDPAMSFSRRDVDLKTVEGRVDFYPLLDERVEGEIKYEEVLVGTQRDDKAKRTDKAYCNYLQKLDRTSLRKEHAAHDEQYASTLASYLERLSDELREEWDLVAVVVPGAMPDIESWHQKLREKLIQRLERRLIALDLEYRAAFDTIGAVEAKVHELQQLAACGNSVLKALEGASSDGCNEAALFFGPVEQMAGLERPIVVLVGFQHSRRLWSRWRVDDQRKMVDPGRVDPAVYQALTRCNYRVVVIEPHARHMMRHYMMRKRADDGIVPWSGEDGGTDGCLDMQGDQPFVRTGVRRSLSELSSSPDSGTITELIVDGESETEWKSVFNAEFPRKLPFLRTLQLCSVGGVQVEWTLRALSGLKQLRTLNLGNTQLCSVDGLGSLTQLQDLDLYGNKLTSVTALESLKGLKGLNLGKNQLTSEAVKCLKSLGQLQKLSLDQNRLDSVGFLDSLKQLKVLYLHTNELTSVDALGSLTNLEDLYLNDNKLTSVTALESLEGLKVLDLYRNKLVSADGLGSAKQVKVLDLHTNELTSVNCLGSLTQLQVLSLAHNKLTSVDVLGSLTQLLKLSLNDNQLTNEAVKCLKLLTQLQELSLFGNDNLEEKLRKKFVGLESMTEFRELASP